MQNTLIEEIEKIQKEINQKFEDLKKVLEKMEEINQKKDDNELLTRQQVAELMKISPNTVSYMISTGKFPSKVIVKKPNLGYRFKKRELFEYLGLS